MSKNSKGSNLIVPPGFRPTAQPPVGMRIDRLEAWAEQVGTVVEQMRIMIRALIESVAEGNVDAIQFITTKLDEVRAAEKEIAEKVAKEKAAAKPVEQP